MADRTRAARITKRIREELSLSLKRDIGDPRLARVLISRVEVPDDLQLATVFIRIEPPAPQPDGTVAAEGSPEEAAVRKNALAALKSAAGKLRTSISPGLGLKYTPQLRFLYDAAQETSTRVAVLLREIEKERRGAGLARRGDLPWCDHSRYGDASEKHPEFQRILAHRRWHVSC